MKLTIESTTKIVTANGIQCRVWEGKTESGVEVSCLIPRIAVKDGQDTEQFESELQEMAPPSPEIEAWPLKMII
jgi:hypothetical protein